MGGIGGSPGGPLASDILLNWSCIVRRGKEGDRRGRPSTDSKLIRSRDSPAFGVNSFFPETQRLPQAVKVRSRISRDGGR